MNPAIARRRHAKAAASKSRQANSDHKHADHKHSNHHGINVGQAERQISLIGGGILAAYGLFRGSLSGLALAALGGALVWRGYSGHCEMYHQLGYSTADQDEDHSSRQPNSTVGRGQSVTADVPL